VEQSNQATNINMGNSYNISKSRKTTREKKERTHEICLPSSVQCWPSMAERAALCSTI